MSGGGMPELGSRISLISKADIRYEGRLFTVDPQECTIALAGVQSFGTEERETQYPIAPQSQIYEYILFRGSDIKDIRVINNCSIPNDPAIMQMHLPSSSTMMQPSFQAPGFNVPGSMPHMGNVPPQMGNFAPFNPLAGFGNVPNTNVNVANPQDVSKKGRDNVASSTSNVNSAEKQAEQKTDGAVAGASRSITPLSLSSRKSPTVDMAVQTGASKDKNNQRDANNKPKYPGQQRNMTHQRQDNNQGSYGDYRYNRNPRQYNQNRGWNNRPSNQMNPRNRFRGRISMQGSFGNRGASNRGKNILKFESDYDFEQANSRFEELRLQLSKIKVADEAKPPQPNGEAEKKEDSGNETAAGEHEQEDDEVGYDKTKSFFDNISCEAMERSKGKTQRTDWRQERKLNSETFGVSSNRRGNFRARGGGYFGRGGMNFNNRQMRDDHRPRQGPRPNQHQQQQQQPQGQQRSQGATANK